jgi:hypothetical protein
MVGATFQGSVVSSKKASLTRLLHPAFEDEIA